MPFTERNAPYFDLACQAIADWKERGENESEPIARFLMMECPECGEIPPEDEGDTKWPHCVMDEYVVIGCEGYWVIDPNLLGIHSPGWTDSEGN